MALNSRLELVIGHSPRSWSGIVLNLDGLDVPPVPVVPYCRTHYGRLPVDGVFGVVGKELQFHSAHLLSLQHVYVQSAFVQALLFCLTNVF